MVIEIRAMARRRIALARGSGPHQGNLEMTVAKVAADHSVGKGVGHAG